MRALGGEVWAVTGAAGKIGKHLRAYLRGRVTALVAIDIEPIDDAWANETGVIADVRDEAAMIEALVGCDGVVHLGGIPDEADFHDLADTNIVGTYHVLEAARRNGLRRVVYASSNRITGFYPAGQTIDSTMPVRPDGFYGVSKAAGEALCQLYADKFELSTICIRIGTYQEAPTVPREVSTWLSHDDALRAIEAAMTTESTHATFYAVSRNTQRWWDLAAGELVGFVPRDNAAEALPGIDALPAVESQGGEYVSVDYSLSRMRPMGR